jgi:hypothetical protein
VFGAEASFPIVEAEFATNVIGMSADKEMFLQISFSTRDSNKQSEMQTLQELLRNSGSKEDLAGNLLKSNLKFSVFRRFSEQCYNNTKPDGLCCLNAVFHAAQRSRLPVGSSRDNYSHILLEDQQSRERYFGFFEGLLENPAPYGGVNLQYYLKNRLSALKQWVLSNDGELLSLIVAVHPFI